MKETVQDIISELRGHARDGVFVSGYETARLADRIEAAHNREVDELEKQQAYDSKLEEDLAMLYKENERLRGALKPVLECHLCNGGTQVVSDALCAIREAKEIIKGETK